MNVPTKLKLAIERLSEAALGHSHAAELAREVLPLLTETATELSGVVREARRGTGKIEYLVETTQQGEVITERRLSGNSQPYRCSKAIYDGVAHVLAEADRPLHLDDIVTAVERRVGVKPSDFHARLPLRLWLHVSPPLILRDRARYRAVDSSEIARHAKMLWNTLKE